MSFYKKALKLAEFGFFVFPINPNSKTPAVPFKDAATRDPDKIKMFWVDPVMGWEQPFNIGISTSHFIGNKALVVIDVDNNKGKKGSEELLKLEISGKNFPATFAQKTPTGGEHLVYLCDKPLKQGVNVLAKGLDIRSRGGYIVAAGSEIDGKSYTANSFPVAKAPDWLIKECEKREIKPIVSTPKVEIDQDSAVKRAVTYLKSAEPAIEGAGGDHATFRVCSRLKDFGLKKETALSLLISHWNGKCEPPWDPYDLKQKIENAYSYGACAPGSDSASAEFEEVKEAEEKKSPVEELNREFAFCVIGGKSKIIRTLPGGGVDIMQVSAFHDLLKSKTLQLGKGQPKQLSEVWFSSPKRATYDKVELLPGREAPENVFNLWRGFNCKPLSEDEKPTSEMIKGVELFNEHLLENVCLGDEKLAYWLKGYFAHIIQKPLEKPLTALVFKGKKGVGKNALIERIGNLFRQNFLLTSNKRYVTGNFNKHLEKLLLFVLDEAFWSGDKTAEGILKDLITGTSHLIEHKGSEMYEAKNITRICIIGNEEWLVPATQDERRFAVFNIGAKRRLDKQFFTDMRVLIDEKGGNRLLLRELMDFDLSQIDVNDAPDTEGLLEQKIESLSLVHTWWLGCLQEGVILDLDFAEDGWPAEVGKELLRKAFQKFSKQRGVRSWLPDASNFAKEIQKCCPGVHSKRVSTGSGRMRAYIVPELKACREQFEEFIGHSLKWEDSEGEKVIDLFS